MLRDYWYMLPFAGLAALLGMYLLIRLVLDWQETKQYRQRGYTLRYGSAEYDRDHRPNVRR